MAFTDPVQLILIAVVVLVVFLWGPKKIPELARSIARAKKEFDSASKEMPSPTIQGSEAKTSGESLLDAARQLGISTEGKTPEQIAADIVKRVKTFS